jgi:hypothetical protein
MGYRIALLIAAVATSSLIAVGTYFRTHPDEYYHADAFRYFEEHWWPPDLGSSDVIYSPQGWSRVYTGEIVYLIVGKLSRGVQLFWAPGKWGFLVYRLSNVGLFLLTLGALFFTQCKWVSPQLIGLTLLCIPQVHYVYAYANSDAWGLSMGVFLFLLVAVMLDRPASSWSSKHFISLGTLTGLVLVSKKPYLFTLMLPYFLLGTRSWQVAMASDARTRQRLFGCLFLALVLAAAIVTPLRVIYPLTQGDFGEAVEEMREEKAAEEFKPSNPTYETYRLASKGEGYYKLLVERSWLELSLKSFYGLYGYMNVRNPGWVYALAGIGTALAVCVTLLGVAVRWSNLPKALQVSIVFSPVIFILNTLASMVQSLHVGFQPQGRYLFPSLIPVALMMTGGTQIEARKLRTVRTVIFGISYAVCLYSLFRHVLFNPALSRF